jgi:integrase
MRREAHRVIIDHLEISPMTSSPLSSWDPNAPAAVKKWSCSNGPSAPAHRSPSFGPGSPPRSSARWKRLERLAGVRPIGLHGARHTHATLALAAGARLDVVSRQLGHVSIAILADVYGHPDDEAAQAAEIVGRVISES